MEKPSRLKQVVMIVALLLALAVSALAAAFIVKMVMENEPARPAQQALKHTDSLVGGPCDGCELMYTGMPAAIHAQDTSAGWREAAGAAGGTT